MEPAVAKQIFQYIGALGVDQETARDLYQEAETAIWEAETRRATHHCHSYLVKTGIGAIRHWLRDRYRIIRIPRHLYDRGKAAEYAKTILPLDDMAEMIGEEYEDELLDRNERQWQRQQILRLLPRLTRAERAVIKGLLDGQSIHKIARARHVRVGSIYAQRQKAIVKLRRLLVA
jgi:RNA polymerase sigma factor (sigma-70 family)